MIGFLEFMIYKENIYYSLRHQKKDLQLFAGKLTEKNA